MDFVKLFCILSFLGYTSAQVVVGVNPPSPSTVSLYKPVSATSTCGSPVTEMYCRYTANAAESLSPNCNSQVCNNTCRHSSSSPSPIDLTGIGTQGGGVTQSLIVGPGNSNVLEFTDSFISIPSSSAPQIGSNGFTFATWMKQDSGNNGALVSKASNNGDDRTYAVSVTESSVVFDYLPETVDSGYSTLTLNNLDLSSSYWHHIAITVYSDDFALYINGTFEKALGLVASIDDTATDTLYLGQILPAINHYNGLMQDVHFYTQALTAREVEEIVTGELPYNYLQTECRCPPSHPVINSASTGLCIQQTGTVTARGAETRLNSLSHPAGYINDNNFITTWISAIDTQQSNVTMPLVSGSNSAYELILLFIRFDSPAPKAAVLEKSKDGGKTFTPLQYFSSDCNSYFGMENDGALQGNDDVNCITQYSSQIPTSGRTITIRFADGTRGVLNSMNTKLLDFILADHIRLRLVDYFTENTTNEHRYYSLKDITVAARCACNYHAADCSSDLTAVCGCIHNTQGDRCEECLPLYNDKPWRQGTAEIGYPCKLCDCNNHASSCHYNASIDPFPGSYDLGGGGVCDDCQDNTAGTYCETCAFSYYRKTGIDPSDSEPCTACECSPVGSLGEDCVKQEGLGIVGQCECKTNVQTRTCDECKVGFFNLSSSNMEGCQPCDCSTDGTIDGDSSCTATTGQCTCKSNVVGLKCTQCLDGTYGLSSDNVDGCSPCNCNESGSINASTCDTITGDCTCKPGVAGMSCDQCSEGFYSFTEDGCQQCQCSDIGSVSIACNVNDGACSCKPGYIGQNCDQCAEGYFNSSQICTPCQCNVNGTVAGQIDSCDAITGHCSCKENVIGRDCDACALNYTNLQSSGCEVCDCLFINTDTSQEVSCDPVTSQCSCLPSAEGLKCDSCKDSYYADSDQMCQECNCNGEGALNTICTPVTGQCLCSENIVGRTCDVCAVGYYDFPNCIACQCNISGSIGSVCNSSNGQCECKEFVTGTNCNECVSGYTILEESNPFGCSSKPEEQAPPTASTVLSNSIVIRWQPPAKPNGVIAFYTIIRDNAIIDSIHGAILFYNDTGLTPNTDYVYQIESNNIVGESTSTGVTITTLEGAPEQVSHPLLTVVSPTSIKADWIAPNVTNGIITNYNLVLVAVNDVVLESSITHFSGLAFTYTVAGLTPFTDNTFLLEACTSQKCGSSEQVTIRTEEDVPESQTPPTLTTINSSAIQVTWTEPMQPNGIIVKYELLQRGFPFTDNGMSIANISNNILSFTVVNLQSFTDYEFSVSSFTTVGGKQSDWTRGKTGESVPEDLFDPIVTPISSSELNVQWTEPAKSNGVITLYQIFIQYNNSSTNSVTNSTSIGSHVVVGLSPFTSYGFYVQVCNTAGCTSSSIAVNTTLESAPTGLQALIFSSISSTSLNITWNPPSTPNGIITNYSVRRSQVGLQSSPARRDIGTPFYGAYFASYPPSLDLSGDSTTITLMFKTLRPDGVLIYSIDSLRMDMIAIELRGGIPWFIFDAGDGPAAITLDGNITYNDGKWHTLTASTTGIIGEISVDDTSFGFGTSPGSAMFIAMPSVLYIGGLENDAALTTIKGKTNPNATLNGFSFAGCLFGVKFNGNYLNLSSLINPNPGIGSSSNGCPIEQETGITFLGGGYISLPFSSPRSAAFSLSIWFRTQKSSNLLFFAYASDSYILAMVDNANLVVKVKGTGSDEISLSSAQISLTSNLCNGNWYKLDIVKESNDLIVEIANQTISSSTGDLDVNVTSNLYIGGLPVSSEAWNDYYGLFSVYPMAFSGCMRNFQMDGESVNLHQDFGDAIKHIRFDGCDSSPVDSSRSCNPESSSYATGLETSFADTGLSPFTGYLYQVTAENSAGESFSPWGLEMTGEGSPEQIGVVEMDASSSSSLSVRWSQQPKTNGLVTQYTVTATPLSTVGLDSPNGEIRLSTVEIESPNQELSVELSGLEPASNYSLVLDVYTGAGVGSGPTVYLSTSEDVPIGVQTPTATILSSTQVLLQWDAPSQPNGIITMYTLYIADTAIGTASNTVTVQSLEPFTLYGYTLEACTDVGCANSTMGSVFTIEGVPVGLSAPSLVGLSSTRVQASWTNPSQPNGVITRYELFRVFGQDLSQTELIANSSQLSGVADGLLPNTLYYFKVIAYNSVGSVTSNVSLITTPEDTPEQVFPPVLTVVNSTSLLITWEEPLQPNGIITSYTLFRDDASIFIGVTTDFTFLDTGLDPFTEYEYFIVACTAEGCGASTSTTETTDEAIPELIQQPEVTSFSSNSASILVKPVGQPNGLVTYILRISGEFLLDYNGDVRITMVETRVLFNHSIPAEGVVGDLIPFTDYTVWVEVMNTAGSVFSEINIFTTSQAVPQLLSRPEVSSVSAVILNVTWLPPVYPNGNITSYSLDVVSSVDEHTLIYSADTTSAILNDLKAFTQYTVFVTAFNVIGNVTSEGTVIMTGETIPTDFDHPIVTSTTAYSIAITWDPPAAPNGIITSYTVETLLSGTDIQVDISTFPASVLQHNITGLLPFNEYNITVEACNSAGCESALSIVSMTDEAAPEVISAPTYSVSSTSVTVSWKKPQTPNGEITHYTLYRAVQGEAFFVVHTAIVLNEEQILQFTDSSIEPFTTYEYYIEASNSAGSGVSIASSVLTEEAKPENVLEPVLEALSSTSVLVSVLSPIKPNGIIIKYTVGRYLLEPSDVLYTDVSVSNGSFIDTGLVPYTVYSYFVIASTIAGNTTSNTSTVRTLEAPPTDLDQPSVILSSDTSILIGWEPPMVENGVITSYQVLRGSFGHVINSNQTELYLKSLRDCCNAHVEDTDDLFSSGTELSDDCTIVTETDSTSYIDSDLDPYTYYAYCITAYNGAGGVASEPSEFLQTSPAPQPLSGPTVTAVAINSTAILVYWSTPDPSVLLGPLISYTLYGKEAMDDGMGDELVTGLDQQYIYTGLTPSTTYTFVVGVSNSRGIAFGEPVDETTMDGIPIGVQDPVMQITSATSLIITWVEPLMPNGEIIKYSIFLNSELYHNQSTPGSVVVNGLKPFTTYTARLEACTALGCTKSGLSVNKTFEAAPSGFASPGVDILSPYEAFVSWTAPLQPNGVVTQYRLNVREQGSEKNLVFSGLGFNYTVISLNPATQYGFEIVAINGGGNVSSGFTTESTHETAPSFVVAPVVHSLSAISISIEWEEPIESNGAITGYNLYRNGEMINLIMINALSYIDTGLSPFTYYSYVLEACTIPGCTNSTTESNTTLEATPANFADPLFSNIQSDSFVISWSEPDSPNGVITNYTVIFTNGTQVFNGLSNSATLQGLSPYSSYSFVVTVCNSAGCLDSNTLTVSTLESAPLGLSAPTVKGLSSMAVEVSWQPPTQPNGVVTSYRLRRDGNVIFDGLALVYDDEELEGDTQYAYTIEAINSVGSVVSPVIAIHTQADIPSGVASPTTQVISSTEIFVQWNEPESSNGVLSAYKLFVNDEQVLSDFVFNHTVTGLTPATEYMFYIQVCNQIGCASSKSVTSTTEEDIPTDLAEPTLTPLSATTVIVSWNPPAMPNGEITTYRILRRETENPLLILIQYVGGKDVTTFTNQDLEPYTSYEYQVHAFNSKGSVESEWSEVTTLEAPPSNLDPPSFPIVQSTYVIVSWNEPDSSNGILQQYQVLYRMLLEEFTLYETVPASVAEVNVTGLSPFTFYEFKIIATNNAGDVESSLGDVQTLEDAPNGLGLIVLVTKTSESFTLTWNEASMPNGIIFEYVIYLNGVEEYRDSPRSATVDRLKPFTSYAVELEACTSVACTRSEVIQSFTTKESSPIGQPTPTLALIGTRSVRVSWDFPLQSNGIIIAYDVLRSEVPEPLVDNTTENAILIHSTTDVSNRVHTDINLTPDTGYQYAVRANNSVGYSLSAFKYIQTPQDAPEYVQPAVLEVLGTNSIKIVWDPPSQKNGELTQYQIYRTTLQGDSISVQVYTGLNRQFTDTGLSPYTQYIYVIEACTIAGCTNSSFNNATTDESVPESIETPQLVAFSSSSISITWSPPQTPNGVLVSYEVNVISPVSINITQEPNILSTTVSSLEPYVEYTIRIQACTIVGCVVSSPDTVRTLQSIPMSQGAPTLLALGPSSVDVIWSQPGKPNGIIITYILRRNNTVVYEGSDTSFIDSSLQPNQKYSYDVQSFTSIGGGERSISSVVTTHSDTPTGINPPVLLSLDSTSILATWAVPNVTNGDIQKYVLFVNDNQVYEGPGLGNVVSGLSIFTTYSFRIEACTSTCGSSLYNYATTKEDLPEDMTAPVVTLTVNQTVLITWVPPLTPNGVILAYTIERARVVNGVVDTIVSIAEGLPVTSQEYLDSDNSLSPATTYNYRVSATNSVGSVTSDFTSITLPDGTPQDLSAPSVVSVLATSFTVSVTPPAVPNGVLTQYTLFGDNLFPIVVTPSTQDDPIVFTHSDLEPYTTYRVYAEVCTVGGCGLGSVTTILTSEDTPEGLLAPFVATESPRRIRVEWTLPSKPNGVITGYQLYYKLPCPQPQVSLTATAQLCTETNYKLVVSTTSTIHYFDSTSSLLDPHPYTSYQFMLQVENSAGAINSSESDVITTDESIPQQVNPLLFTVYTNNQSIALNWGSTFRLNGQLKSYTVIRDGVFLFIGTQTYAVFPNQPVNTILQFSVRASNINFQSTSSSVPLEISKDTVVPSVTMTTPTNTTTVSPADTPFYEDAAFIVGMVVLGIIVCFVLLIICLCIIRPNEKQTTGKYDTLRSEKGSPLHENGTIGSGWTHDRMMTPVPSYNDALHNYPSAGRRTPTSYSPTKGEFSLDNSYSPNNKAELSAYYLQATDEAPLVDTHISRLSIHEESIPMKEFTPDQKRKIYLKKIDESPSEASVVDEPTASVTLRKNMALTDSQESMLDTKI